MDNFLDKSVSDHRDAMTSQCDDLNKSIDDFDVEYNQWATYNQKESMKPQAAVSHLMALFSHNQTKTIATLETVNDSFGKISSVNDSDFQTSQEIENEEKSLSPRSRIGSPAANEGEVETLSLQQPSPTQISADRYQSVEQLLANSALAESFGKAYKSKLDNASDRLSSIFAQGKREYTTVVKSLLGDEDSDADQLDGDLKGNKGEDVSANLIPILQQKVVNLKKELEDMQMKARSITVQW